VPARTRAEPAIIARLILSPRRIEPQSMPKTGMRKVTVKAFVGPSSEISL